jgi:hypothetical protein
LSRAALGLPARPTPHGASEGSTKVPICHNEKRPPEGPPEGIDRGAQMSAPVEWPRSYGYLYAQTASMNVSPLCIASHFSLKPKRLWSVPGLTEYPDTLAALSPPAM